MRKLARAGEREGYEVLNLGYPSRKKSPQELVDTHLLPTFAKAVSKGKRVHFITHSLGGILVRLAFKEGVAQGLGRVVMITPPNQGSEVVDALLKVAPGRWILGKSGKVLGCKSNSLPRQLPPISFECGVITCDRTIDPFCSLFLTPPHDGKVTLKAMRVDGVKSYTLVHASHALAPSNKEVIREAFKFLKSGSF